MCHVSVPERPIEVRLRQIDYVVPGLQSGFARFDEMTGGPERIADVEADLPTTRLNGGRVDPARRLVCGYKDKAADFARSRPCMGRSRTNRPLLLQFDLLGSKWEDALFRMDQFDHDVHHRTTSNRPRGSDASARHDRHSPSAQRGDARV